MMTNPSNWQRWTIYGQLVRAMRYIESLSQSDFLLPEEVAKLESARLEIHDVMGDVELRLRNKDVS